MEGSGSPSGAPNDRKGDDNNDSCHTLILSGDDHWPIFGFLPTELSCLTLIVMQSIGFCDVSKEMCKMFKRGVKWSLWGHFLAPRPIRKLKDEVTSLPGRAAVQPPPLISYK